MNDDSFFATVKILTGEEILTEVMLCEENDEQFFVFHNPIVISENNHVDMQKGVVVSGLVPKKWLLYASDDVTIVQKQHVVSMSELDKFGIDFYKKALVAAMASTPIKKKVETKDNSGFVGKIEAFREKLEDMFDNSP
jgi:4-hydroxy-L-threonine phosphate dehydrogenase PdxA